MGGAGHLRGGFGPRCGEGAGGAPHAADRAMVLEDMRSFAEVARAAALAPLAVDCAPPGAIEQRSISLVPGVVTLAVRRSGRVPVLDAASANRRRTRRPRQPTSRTYRSGRAPRDQPEHGSPGRHAETAQAGRPGRPRPPRPLRHGQAVHTRAKLPDPGRNPHAVPSARSVLHAAARGPSGGRRAGRSVSKTPGVQEKRAGAGAEGNLVQGGSCIAETPVAEIVRRRRRRGRATFSSTDSFLEELGGFHQRARGHLAQRRSKGTCPSVPSSRRWRGPHAPARGEAAAELLQQRRASPRPRSSRRSARRDRAPACGWRRWPSRGHRSSARAGGCQRGERSGNPRSAAGSRGMGTSCSATSSRRKVRWRSHRRRQFQQRSSWRGGRLGG